MNYLRLIVTWIASLESGGPFRKWISIFIKILGVLALIGAIVWGIAICIGSIAASAYLGTGSRTLVVVGAILVICVDIVIGLVLLLLFWNRSNKITSLGNETHFTLIPITIILIRLLGEFSFLSLVGAGIQSLIASIFGVVFPNLLSIFMSELGRDINFVIGAISFVISVLSGVILLIIHYFIAELINLFVDMATNLEKIEEAFSTEDTSENHTSDS